MINGPSRIPASGSVRKIIVFLHGYGASGDDLIDIANEWSDRLPDTLFVSPHAPDVCDVSPSGYQWFGLKDFNPLNIRQGLESAAPIVCHYIEHLMDKYTITANDIALVGFSQGSILAMELLFRIPNLGGILGYSGAFYPPKSLERPLNPPNVLLVHGTADMVVPFGALYQAQMQLQMFGVDVHTHVCEGLGHSIDTTGLTVGCTYLYQSLFQSNPQKTSEPLRNNQ